MTVTELGLLAVLPALLLLVGCTARLHLHTFQTCADGLPVQILTDPRCPPDGICGYSCCPGRWDQEIPR